MTSQQLTQTDPLPNPPGVSYMSGYVYGNNNPLVYTDPSGLRGQTASTNPMAELVPDALAMVSAGAPKRDYVVGLLASKHSG